LKVKDNDRTEAHNNEGDDYDRRKQKERDQPKRLTPSTSIERAAYPSTCDTPTSTICFSQYKYMKKIEIGWKSQV